MKAMVRDAYGSYDVLHLEDIDVPEISDDEVLVEVRAAGVDRGVWHVMTGLPYMVRLAGYGARRPRTRVLGSDVAGDIAAVGARVTGFEVGQPVFGMSAGSYAEYARAAPDTLVAKPDDLPYEDAAAIPTSGVTALQALRDKGEIERGARVLVIGAAGGVGTFAVQLAHNYGATVTGVCSTAKVGALRAIGADRVIDYTRDEVTEGDQRHDLVVDIAGNRPLALLRRTLTPNGTLVIVGGEGGGRWLGGTDRQLRALASSPLSGQRLRSLLAKPSAADLQYLADLVHSAALTPIVDSSYPLSDVAGALHHLEYGHPFGKVVITV
jgi:NADPH:quinone reductase-like Zn-dependent oxidoreductase